LLLPPGESGGNIVEELVGQALPQGFRDLLNYFGAGLTYYTTYKVTGQNRLHSGPINV